MGIHPPTFSLTTTATSGCCRRSRSDLLDAIDHLRRACLGVGPGAGAGAARALVAAAAPLPPDTLLSNRLLHLLASHPSTLPDARRLFYTMPCRDLCSYNTLLAAYSAAGHLPAARELFDKMTRRDQFSWTTIMSGHTRHGLPREALALYRRMQESRNNGDADADNEFTASCVLAAAAAAPCARSGKQVHCHIVRARLDTDAVVWSALADMYAKCGCIADARRVFDWMPVRDVVSWTAMIERYFENGRVGEGFGLFVEMLRSGIRPNGFTFAGVLRACAEFTIEGLGWQVHGHMVKVSCGTYCFAESTLVHMYSKCGDLLKAKSIFEGMSRPDLVSWTSMISSYAQNGQPMEAIRYFEIFLDSGIKPDHVAFVGVLSACAHAGLVNKGLEVFHSIKEEHGIEHTADHYACVIDLLSRAGRFQEAEEMIDKMTVKPNKFLWAALLGGCRIHKNVRLARRAAEALFEIEPENPATYVTLANIYGSVGLFDEAETIRKIMATEGMAKKPASSWIEVRGKVHAFLVGDKSHPQAKDIYVLLGKLNAKMREEGYVPNTDFVLHDVEDEQKEHDIGHHSERLAVAFGIIATPQGTPIKVFKNLRICGDCHVVMKLISRIIQRVIVVRDSNRFHHFKDGRCSCGDYW